jgi:hypothetical protein
MEGHDDQERLRRIEEKLDRLLEREDISAVTEREEDQSDAQGAADLALSVRSGKNGRDGMYVCLAEIANYGEAAATGVRWWLSTEAGDVVSTVAGGDEVKLDPRDMVELEVVEVPGWEKFPLARVWCRLAWHDAEGDHEKRRLYAESAAVMHPWKWKRPTP